MRITIETIPHADQRYPTCGDWLYIGEPPTELRIRVSGMDDWRLEALVAVHELVEALLCRDRGISGRQVDEFDQWFDRPREWDSYTPDEPGDHPMAPYRAEHNFATGIERLLCAAFGVDWARYEARVDAL